MPTSNLEPDPHFLSQSLKPQVHISHPLSYEDADRYTYSSKTLSACSLRVLILYDIVYNVSIIHPAHLTPESEFPGPVECVEDTEAVNVLLVTIKPHD